MWIRGTARPLVAALLGIEISIIALASAASAASAAPMTPDGELRLTPHIRHDNSGEHRAATGKDRETTTWKNREAAGRHGRDAKRARAETSAAAKPLLNLDLGRVKPRHAMVRMSHDAAAGYLLGAGLRYKSTGHCTNRHVHTCTSLDLVRTGTIARIIALKQASTCPIMVTGGTEVGHSPGRFSHGKGYKLDISHNACIDRYIHHNSERTGVRGDGAALYRSPSGTLFADESDHWDILFK
ncbi:hypothetical protein [Nonomuraea lactucae]|uniref:hypothetical protein n=1 Tax=Nonomuraea lactucae TaxID=2249762 RepID=UPI00196694A5|nr:hypothetical protein [Nonomuraea lactucae]